MVKNKLIAGCEIAIAIANTKNAKNKHPIPILLIKKNIPLDKPGLD